MPAVGESCIYTKLPSLAADCVNTWKQIAIHVTAPRVPQSLVLSQKQTAAPSFSERINYHLWLRDVIDKILCKCVLQIYVPDVTKYTHKTHLARYIFYKKTDQDILFL